MRKKCILMIVACIALATANAPTAMAQDVTGTDISHRTLPITGVTEATDGNYNFKSFEVDASEAGSYYTEFWLLPTKYANNRYSTFIIYVNENYIGTINPTVGNWQAARVDGHETFNLSEGKNLITIATRAPEFPEVETIKAALNDADASFSSEAYKEYLEDAAEGVSYDIPADDGIAVYSSDADGTLPKHLLDVPLNYTFYKTFSFTKDQEIFITTSSSASHKIDIVYYGSAPVITVTPAIINPASLSSEPVTPGITQPYIKQRNDYTPATSEEMQGLSWVFPSEKSLNSSMQVANARVRIPKSGQYLIRVRHVVTGGSALADVNVNGAYYYESTPITLSYAPCIIPADGNYYATYTLCNYFSEDDPYLFIHGGGCDKIVGFNDDAPRENRRQYNLSTWDSFISQKYLMKTSGVSVSNYSSSKPVSQCSIFVGISNGDTQPAAKSKSKGSNTAGVSEQTVRGESVQIIGPANISGSISVYASDKIHKISVYGLVGNCIGTINGKDTYEIIEASTLNITQPGIYVISVETASGTTSKKIAIK